MPKRIESPANPAVQTSAPAQPAASTPKAPAKSAAAHGHNAFSGIGDFFKKIGDEIVNDAAKLVGYTELAGFRYPVSKYESPVSPTLTRGSRLDDQEAYAKLVAQGYKGIVDLTAEGTDDEKYATRAGLNLVNIKIIDNDAPTLEQMQQFLDFATTPANQPTYVHCEAGKGRTGCAVACYRMAVQHWTLADALADAQKNGLGLPNQTRFLRDFDAALTAGKIDGYHR